jgi:SanA protein
MLKRFFQFVLVVAVSLIVFSNVYIIKKSTPYLYNDTDHLPKSNFGIVLGTNKYLLEGGINVYFADRVAAAGKLYHAGSIKKIVVSGHVEGRYYNEPEQIKAALVKLGVDTPDIVIDTTGDRTLKTVKNLKLMGINDSVVIISQKFHNQRAVFLAREMGVESTGYNVPDQLSKKNYKTYIREVFAKTMAFLEVVFK